LVSPDSNVRVIDCFLDFALGSDLGFKVNQDQRTGRPSFPVGTLLGIYIYGYLNKVRSSRDLQKACEVNVELWWLLHEQKPSYKTIANFRKDNNEAFKTLFKIFRDFCKKLELYGRSTVAIDGTKIRGQNSRKNNFNINKINRHLEYIATQEEYLKTLEQEDEIDEKLKKVKARKEKYENLKKQLEDSGETQISTTDPDARSLPLNMNMVEVGYNIQSAVDDKHNLIVDYEVTNKTDINALGPMAIKSKNALDIQDDETLTILADKGYYKGEQIHKCHEENLDTLVAPLLREDKKKAAHVRKSRFSYDAESNEYICPNNERLSYQATYKRRKGGKNVGQFDRYNIKYTVCINCPYFKECVTPSQQKSSQGRTIDRCVYEPSRERNNEQIATRRSEYKKRQAIVEHPFGTIKRQLFIWLALANSETGMYYTMMKTKPKVETEISIIFLCYNLRRVMSILGQEGLKKAFFAFNKRFLSMISTIDALIRNFAFQIYNTPQKLKYF
jgi:transposase